jgi:hypothetical protein
MYPALGLAIAFALLAGAAFTQDRAPTPRPGDASEAAGEAAPQSGSSEPSAPATQESQGLRLDEGSGNPPSPRGAARAEDCPEAGAAPAAGARADCGPGQNPPQQR